MKKLVEASLSFERISCPLRQEDGFYYWQYSSGLQPRDVLMRSDKPPSVHSQGQIVYDGNSLKDESLFMYSWSESGSILALSLQEFGSDWQKIRTVNSSTGKQVEADLCHSKFTFGVCFLGDEGYLYKRILPDQNSDDDDDDNSNNSADGQFGLFYHTIGSDQSQDVLAWKGVELSTRSPFTANNPRAKIS